MDEASKDLIFRILTGVGMLPIPQTHKNAVINLVARAAQLNDADLKRRRLLLVLAGSEVRKALKRLEVIP